MVNNANRCVLTDEEIVKVIIDYVEENLYKYAVLIDGEWGCGKTYFIKEYLYEKLKEHENNKDKESCKSRKIIYISLYGVKSVDEVSKQILLESYLSNKKETKSFMKKGVEVTSVMLPVLFDVMKAKGLEINLDNVSNAANGLLSVKNSILIFDDLERCDCPINEILGYINTFVEHEEMKVIIIANQKEIRKNTYLVNQELKYLVAAHENIAFEGEIEKQSSKMHSDKKTKEQEPVELSVVESRMNKLFGQDKSYERIKEKLVGITIYYHPMLQKVFVKLIKNESINSNLQKLLLEKVSFFAEYMVNEKHTNIRTFQFFLSKVCDLYEAIQKLEDEGKEKFFNCIMEYSFRVCVCYKNNILEYKWKGNEEYGFKRIGKTCSGDGYQAFRFVDDFVMKSALDENCMKKMFEVYANEYIRPQSDYMNRFYKLEHDWNICTDDEVEEQIEEILKDLEENKHEIKNYDRIISLFLDLEEIGFSEENTKKAILKMKDNIKDLKSHIVLRISYFYEGNTRKKERMEKIMYELQSIIDEYYNKQILQTMEQFLLIDDGWAEKLENYIKENEQEIDDNSGLLSQMSIENLAIKIKDSKVCDIQTFRNCIRKLYLRVIVGDALKKDSEKINELLAKVEKLDNDKFDKVKKVQVRWLIEDLERAKRGCEK